MNIDMSVLVEEYDGMQFTYTLSRSNEKAVVGCTGLIKWEQHVGEPVNIDVSKRKARRLFKQFWPEAYSATGVKQEYNPKTRAQHWVMFPTKGFTVELSVDLGIATHMLPIEVKATTKEEALRIALRQVTSAVERDYKGEPCNEDNLLFTAEVVEV